MEQKQWHQMDVDELQQVLHLRPEQGLTEEEAGERRKTSGYNELSEGRKFPRLFCF